jgi:hypothetical protein
MSRPTPTQKLKNDNKQLTDHADALTRRVRELEGVITYLRQRSDLQGQLIGKYEELVAGRRSALDIMPPMVETLRRWAKPGSALGLFAQTFEKLLAEAIEGIDKFQAERVSPLKAQLRLLEDEAPDNG